MNEFLAGVPVGEIGWPVILAGVVIAIIRGDLVPRKTFDAVREDRDFWREAARRAIEVNDTAVSVAETSALSKTNPARGDEDSA